MADREGGGSLGLATVSPPAGPRVVVCPARPSGIAAVLALWRHADAVPTVSDDPAVAVWVAAGHAHDPRVGRFVRSLRSGAGP